MSWFQAVSGAVCSVGETEFSEQCELSKLRCAEQLDMIRIVNKLDMLTFCHFCIKAIKLCNWETKNEIEYIFWLT